MSSADPLKRPPASGPPGPPTCLASAKIKDSHLRRQAIVYIRQSTPQQVLHNRESTDLQYGLEQRATLLGWPSCQVEVVDEDLGRSGKSAEGRPGFQYLLAQIALGHVGIVLGLEMSRLARSNKDWHHLLELCAIFDTLLADADGVYDPKDHNDRLLLGLNSSFTYSTGHYTSVSELVAALPSRPRP